MRSMLIKFLLRLLFPSADIVISNSHAAAKEVQKLMGVPADRIATIPNAVDVDRIHRLASEPIEDDFYLRSQVPLIVSVGSLTNRKDMSTLIKAFSIVHAKREVRLVIIGKELAQRLGSEREKLQSLIAGLGLDSSVHLPGFDINPYKWVAVASVFASSSTAEGFPNVIAEALALGRPIVATDCQGDTAKLLEHGKWGRLVPVGNPERMATALLAALDDLKPTNGQVRASDFSPSKITMNYMRVLLPSSQSSDDLTVPYYPR